MSEDLRLERLPADWASIAPVNFVFLLEATDRVGRAMYGDNWQHHTFDPPDPVITKIAEACESGELAAIYLCATGRKELERSVWHSGWPNYFNAGTIDLDLPLLNTDGRESREGYAARGTYPIFVGRQDLERIIDGLAKPAGPHPGGAPEQYDWEEGFLFLRKELDKRGDPQRSENSVKGWRSDADVGRAVAAHIAIREPGKPPQEPDFRDTMRKIAPELQRWRGRA